ncbi:hypothetical protein GRX01_06435 [Halobaculum sp. WSA2]|uniref:DUF5658 domain-containing protein n=1 Tax=Halobaculum saliterrae TaxID=2073113 RepID=A0A6B0SPY2_9EURY|nr:hypothetical protein [Halobaculum saliterrae]MXR40978.1 hypothetical protein [Halobaculum saliterrae]
MNVSQRFGDGPVGHGGAYSHDRERGRTRLFLVPGFLLLSATKAADVLTTAVGLALIPRLTELNPIAAAVFGEMGAVDGLVALGTGVVLMTGLAVEFCACEAYRHTGSPTLPALLRIGAYGSLSAVYAFAAVNNALLVARLFEIRLLFI